MAVLADLAMHADEKKELICFVDLDESGVEQLRTMCGHLYQVAPFGDSEVRADGLYLKNSNKQGVLIRASVESIDGARAEAAGSYHHPTRTTSAGAGFHYKLRKERGQWRVSSCEFIAAT